MPLYVKIERFCGDQFEGSYIDPLKRFDGYALFDGAEPDEDESYRLSLLKMSEEEFEALPEFNGF